MANYDNYLLPITYSKQGFTLIELSIVLVIIGLLAGGILLGKDLIKAAEIRSQISQVEEIKTAVNTFRAKYGYLPGDMPPNQASQLGFFAFTGSYAGKISANGVDAYGNNDGYISNLSEEYPAMQHLSQAKLLKGEYGGAGTTALQTDTDASSAGYPSVVNSADIEFFKIYFPMSKYNNAKGIAQITGNLFDLTTKRRIFSNSPKNNMVLIYDPLLDVGGNPIDPPVFTSSDAYQIDSKIDDGLPAAGSVRDHLTSNVLNPAIADTPCTTAAAPFQYDLTPATANNFNCYALSFLF